MEEKYYYLLGIIAIIGVIIISGCVQQGKPEPQMAISPYVEFEATVISLSLEDSEGYIEGNEIYRAPQDSVVVRIDKIIERVNEPVNVKTSSGTIKTTRWELAKEIGEKANLPP